MATDEEYPSPPTPDREEQSADILKFVPRSGNRPAPLSDSELIKIRRMLREHAMIREECPTAGRLCAALEREEEEGKEDVVHRSIHLLEPLTGSERTGIKTVVMNFGHLSNSEILEQITAFAATLSFSVSERVLRELQKQVDVHRKQLVAAWSAPQA